MSSFGSLGSSEYSNKLHHHHRILESVIVGGGLVSADACRRSRSTMPSPSARAPCGMLQRGSVLDVETPPRNARVQCPFNGPCRFAPAPLSGERALPSERATTVLNGRRCPGAKSACPFACCHRCALPATWSACMWLLRSGGQRAQTREGDPLLMRPCVCARMQEKGEIARAHDSARLPSGVG